MVTTKRPTWPKRAGRPKRPTAAGQRAEPDAGVAMDLSDQSFIAASSEAVAAVVADPSNWARWWPDLELTSRRDRGLKGQQWVLAGRIQGSAEIYLEPWHDGTVVNLFLRLRLDSDHPAHPDLERRRRTLAWKQAVNALKDDLEAGRAPGSPALT